MAEITDTRPVIVHVGMTRKPVLAHSSCVPAGATAYIAYDYEPHLPDCPPSCMMHSGPAGAKPETCWYCDRPV